MVARVQEVSQVDEVLQVQRKEPAPLVAPAVRLLGKVALVVLVLVELQMVQEIEEL